MSLGSLIFNLHCFLTDASTLIAWNWSGYPVRGPLPHLHGGLTFLAQTLGLAGSLLLPPGVLRHPIVLGWGGVSCFVLYRCDGWLGYFGGLCYAVFLMSIIPMTLGNLSNSPRPAKNALPNFLRRSSALLG